MPTLDNSPVRSSANNVMEQATHVTVNESRIPSFVEYLIEEYEFYIPIWDGPVFPSIEDHTKETVVRFFIVSNALNYCFDDFETGESFVKEYRGEKYTGAYGMFASIKEIVDTGQPFTLNPNDLQQVGVEDVRDAFSPVDGRNMPMLESRAHQLREIGSFLEANHTFVPEAFQGDVELYGEGGVVETLVRNDAYTDVREYVGEEVRFDKRAQLAVSSIYGHMYSSTDAFDIVDPYTMTIFADYGIPAVLRSSDVIGYSRELEQDIQQMEEIPEGSEKEIEIRAATVVAGDLILEELWNQGFEYVTVPMLDNVLWRSHHGVERQTHMTRTTAY